MSVTMRDDLGRTNIGWGVCGFTSTFYAMWALNPAGARAALVNAPKPFNVLAEIKQYLKILQAEANTTTLAAITDFTRSFGKPYHKFDVASYIASIDKARSQTDEQIEGNALYGIAMPPQSVGDYASRIWGYDYGIAMGDAGGNAIIGVKDATNKTMTEYRGLCHYLYRQDNRYYSWGQSFASLPAADRNFQVVWTISLKPKGR